MNVKLNSKTRHNLKNMNPKNSRKKSPIHENAGANITCDFGDGDISRSRSFLSSTCTTGTTGANGRTNPHSHVDFLNLIIDNVYNVPPGVHDTYTRTIHCFVYNVLLSHARAH